MYYFVLQDWRCGKVPLPGCRALHPTSANRGRYGAPGGKYVTEFGGGHRGPSTPQAAKNAVCSAQDDSGIVVANL
jgi:hypothetical protein